MNGIWTLRFAICLAALGFSLYGHIEKQNQITQARIQLPEIARQLKAIQEDNTRLRYEIEQFESPEHLIELARQHEFSHLRHPLVKEVRTLPQGIAVQIQPAVDPTLPSSRQHPSITLATGAPKLANP